MIMNKSKTQKIVISALFAALVCIATMIIRIPSPIGGYLNMGDCIILLAGWLLSPLCAAASAAIGSAIADVLSGFAGYALATFVIKALVALTAYAGFKYICKNKTNTILLVLVSVVAELVMIALYYIFEGLFLYGFEASLANIIQNSIQALANVAAGVILLKIFSKGKMLKQR